MSIRKRIDKGIAHIPEDRQKRGLVLDYTIENNMVLEIYDREPFSKHGLLNKDAIHNYAEKIIKDEALTKRQDEKKNILKPGAEVKISNGSFNGFEGVIDSINSDKAIIMVEIFDRPMKITVNINELTKK